MKKRKQRMEMENMIRKEQTYWGKDEGEKEKRKKGGKFKR